ncbi:MAG: DUF3575 domain-containing protein [Bacteroidales bacterium]|nr:DUF3575 domain-containing protein [Bacteroidales bacterium]
MTTRLLLFLLGCLLACRSANAQVVALSTNAADYLGLGTLNAEISYAADRHWSIQAEGRFNPWTFHAGDPARQFQYRMQTYSAGVRWWPWYVYESWWAGAKAQYQEYNRGGLFGNRRTEEGDAFGIGLSGGYAWSLDHAWSINAGLGFWSGFTRYAAYACPLCGKVTDRGVKFFLLPDTLLLSIMYVF